MAEQGIVNPKVCGFESHPRSHVPRAPGALARYHWGMSIRFRLGLVVGFCAGYYLGARAGEERYKQIRRTLDRVQRSDLAEKARAAVELGIERLREVRDGSEEIGVGLG